MVTAPSFYKYRNSEFIQYLTDIKSIILKHDPKVLKVKPQTIALIDTITVMHEVYKKQLGITITDEIQALDKRRDVAIIGIRSVAEGFTYHFDIVKRNAAEKLINSIDQYGSSIARQNYLAQTTILRNLTEEWRTSVHLKAAIAMLNLNDWVYELKESNDLFNAKYLKRNTEYADASRVNVSELRDEAKIAYSNLINHITAHVTLSLSETYITLVDEINSITKQYNTLVQRRTFSENNNNTSHSETREEITTG